jgi:hypothetical protein
MWVSERHDTRRVQRLEIAKEVRPPEYDSHEWVTVTKECVQGPGGTLRMCLK